jgi:hypothetical protein
MSSMGQYIEIILAMATLAEIWLPSELVENWVSATNDYAASSITVNKINDNTKADIVDFMATVLCMGYNQLPGKILSS